MLRTVPSVALVVLVTGAGFAAPARAGLSYTIEDVRACSRDAVRLCKDKLADLDAIKACMKEKFDELSPKCKERFKASE